MNLRKIQFIIFLIVPVINFGVNILLPSAFDDDQKVLIQPAGYAFSIWGLIFLGMIFYSWFQMQAERVESTHLQNATIAGILAGLASIAFVPISYMDVQWLGFLNILWHLVALIALFIFLRKQIKLESNKNTHWYYMPTQLYLGWISAATAVSTALTLAEAGISPNMETQTIITAVVIGVLTLLGVVMSYQKGGVIPIVFIWALIGIIVENGEYLFIKGASIAGIVILIIIVVTKLIRGQRLSY